MRRRLRKKKHLGEFREFGFSVKAELLPDISETTLTAFADRWIDAIEARGLAFGGGIGRDCGLDGFVVGYKRPSATEDDRRELGAVLDADDAVVRCEVGELVDAWEE